VGLGDELAKNPDHALDPAIAYKVMSYALRKGLCPGGDALYTYINATRCDYLSARRIIFYGRDRPGFISAQDSAAIIQGYAEDLEMLLRVSCNTSFSDSPYRGFVPDRYRYNAKTRGNVQRALQGVVRPRK
jgi:hypothetical protein